MEKNSAKISSRKKGCLISILTVVAVLLWIFWQIGEPDRRARRIHTAIRPGMSYGDVEHLLTGRHYCFFQVWTNDKWRSISQADFTALITSTPAHTPAPLRLQLHFMGVAPRRASFAVELDHNGTVTKVTNPYGWD